MKLYRLFIGFLPVFISTSGIVKAQYADTSDRITGHCNYFKTTVVDARAYDTMHNASVVAWRHEDDVRTNQAERLLRDDATFLTRKLDKDSNELLIVLHDLILDEPTGLVITSGMMNADVFLGRNGKYRLCFHFESYQETRRHRNAGYNLEWIMDALFFKVLDSAAHTPIPMGQEYSFEAAITYRQRLVKQFPLYTAAGYKEGVYRTVNDFLNEAPDTINVVQQDYFVPATQRIMPKVFHRKPNGKAGKAMPQDSVFACFYHGKWFLSRSRGMRLMHVQHHSFYTTLFFSQPIYGFRGDAIFSSMGLVGAIIKTSMMEEANERKDHIDGYETVAYVCKFDPIKKRFIPIEKVPAVEGRY